MSQTIGNTYMLAEWLSQTSNGSDEWRNDDEQLRRLSEMNKSKYASLGTSNSIAMRYYHHGHAASVSLGTPKLVLETLTKTLCAFLKSQLDH
jgi:hypothetical protein